MFIDFNGSPTPLHEVSLDEIHHETTRNVDWTTYIFYSSLRLSLSPLVELAKASLFISNYFRRKDPEYATVQDRINKYATIKHQKYATEDLIELTQRIHALVDPTLKPIILDLVAMEKDLSHIHPILQGANVEVIGDSGFFFNAWKANSNARQRQCSHKHDSDKAYSIRGSFFNEFLFWKDKDTHFTRFQLEANSIHNPLRNWPSLVLHLRDYLNYKISGLQQSQFGQSPFTENKPIRIVFEKEAFIENKADLEKTVEAIQQNKINLL